MSILVQLLVYAFIGFIEMFLASRRTYYISKDKNIQASGIVFIENIVFLLVFYQILNNINNNWPVAISYSLGGSLGTLFKLDRFI